MAASGEPSLARQSCEIRRLFYELCFGEELLLIAAGLAVAVAGGRLLPSFLALRSYDRGVAGAAHRERMLVVSVTRP
jgi:hypothetical protein